MPEHPLLLGGETDIHATRLGEAEGTGEGEIEEEEGEEGEEEGKEEEEEREKKEEKEKKE